MADKQAPTLFTFTAPVVMLYPTLKEPKAFKGMDGKEQGEKKYSARFVIPKEHPDFKSFKDAVIKTAANLFVGQDLKTLGITWPWVDGTKMLEDVKAGAVKKGKKAPDNLDFIAGTLVFRGSSKNEPRLSGIENGGVVDHMAERRIAELDKKFYFGAEVYPSVAIVANEGNSAIRPSVTCYLNNILGTGKGKRLGGGPRSGTDVFSGYQGKVSGENPTAGLDDEIPF